ncbi:hypothetical protein VTO42DRAFT_1086 [Malbranchea cinnamomea]
MQSGRVASVAPSTIASSVGDVPIKPPKSEEVRSDTKALTTIDVIFIGAEAYKRHIRSPKSECLSFTISELDHAIEDKARMRVTGADPEDEEQGVLSPLSFCNFYRRFIRAYSQVAKALYQLTKKDTPFAWTPQCQEAFEKLKSLLTRAPVLCQYDPSRETREETDALDEVIAGVLSQKLEDGCWYPVAFYSSSMSAPEKNYDIHNKEMLAVIKSLAAWRGELEGRQGDEPFKVLTDHRALEYFMTTKKLNAQQARWAGFLSHFRFLIRYRPGKQNTLVDALSRPKVKTKRKERM